MLPPGAPGENKGKTKAPKGAGGFYDLKLNRCCREYVINCYYMSHVYTVYIYILNVHMWAYWGQMFCMNSRSLLTTLNKTCLILNPGLGNRSGHSLDVSLSIINGMLGLSKVGWTYCEGILNRHIWWCLWKNIHMTFWNPFAIHQKLSLANVKFQKIMTNDTYISNYIYIYHHLPF